VNPNELQASQRAGSNPREEKLAVVRSSVVRTVESGCFEEEVEAVELEDFEGCASGVGERLAFEWELEATDPASESDIIVRER
jgi:hypothetical protein